jgi:hypothetical protein
MAVELGVNYLAVIASAIAAVVIGFLYYGASGLNKRWMTLAERPAIEGNPPPSQLAVGVLAALVNAWVLALLSLNLGGSTITDAVMLGVLVWLGFLATLSAATIAFEGRPWSLWVLNNVHHVIVQVVMAVIVTLWR